jgi:hypothetical protein
MAIIGKWELVIEMGFFLMIINQSINQLRRPGPVWAFVISWLNLLWWRVVLTFNRCLSFYF